MRLLITVFIVITIAASAQTPKDVRAVAKQGPSAIPTVAQYLNSAAVDTRVEAIKQLIALGGKDTIDPLIRGTRDTDPEVQIRSIDGLVNYYLPGYVKQGIGSSFVRASATIRAKFSDNNDQVIAPGRGNRAGPGGARRPDVRFPGQRLPRTRDTARPGRAARSD
jgi:hypothetical protein